MNHNKIIRKYTRIILLRKAVLYGLLGLQYTPLIWFLLIVSIPEYHKVFFILLLIFVALGILLNKKLQKLRSRISFYQQVQILYRFENGERFPEGHKERALFVKMLTTLSIRNKDRIE